jgi:hypothetical protein
MQQVTIVAEMADGWTIVEHVETFEDFTSIVLGFRRDSECVRLSWHQTPEPPEPVLYESAGVAPWNQSADLDFELAEADYQWWRPVAAGDELGRLIRRRYWQTQRGRGEALQGQAAA